MNFPADLVELEGHGTSYGGGGVQSHICWPNGSVSSVPQRADELVVALTLARLELEGAA